LHLTERPAPGCAHGEIEVLSPSWRLRARRSAGELHALASDPTPLHVEVWTTLASSRLHLADRSTSVFVVSSFLGFHGVYELHQHREPMERM